jgi:hypothetical protein
VQLEARENENELSFGQNKIQTSLENYLHLNFIDSWCWKSFEPGIVENKSNKSVIGSVYFLGIGLNETHSLTER